MMDSDDQSFTFTPPPEAPIFHPSASDFADPITYIAKIRPTIEKTGICKIRPPQDWQPPFAVDVENFKFIPRVQKINELEATTRVKLLFLNKLFKFWELQGVILKVPTVNRKPLDFHKLHKVVQEEGGYEEVTANQQWKAVAQKMSLPSIANNNKCYGTVLSAHYEKYLYPYDLVEMGASYDPANVDMFLNPNMRATSKSPKKEMDVDYTINSEMKKLQFFGAGRKAALPLVKSEHDGEKKNPEVSPQSGSNVPRRAMRDRSKASYLESDICRLCSLTDNEEDMLTCSNCCEVYHKYCLVPRITGLIRGDWRCPKCVAKEYKKPTEVFGFEQSSKEYSLASFGLMADQFKENYFKKDITEVTCEEVEQEFWRLTNSISKDVTVQYGADIHALTNGSGFPTAPNDEMTETDEKYISSKWNINNLPVNDRSVLKYVSGDVSGMKVPWCYVGMCFSSFCWHIEDHWSYSINYHHWGEPKTWYGVPSSHAEALECVMRSRAPELFEQSPDLLHHITTMMNPNSLMAHNIPVVRTNQCAGEFIVTAPRAFHAGFNQGYNFAEAVNFCPADWLPMGRACISNYKKVKRYCVFSHEELVCKMAADAEHLDLVIAMEAHKELLAIVDQERKLRKRLLEHGVKKAEREAFELLSDDDRQCNYCKTTCFLSAITCPCKPNKVACIEHITQLCHCPGAKKCLRYRYTLDELPAMIRNLGDRVRGYQQWTHNTKTALSAKGCNRISFGELKQLLIEARDNNYPENTVLRSLQGAVKESDKYACLVKEVANRKARTRRHTELAIKSGARRLTVSELANLVTELSSLPCCIKDADLLEDLSSKVTQFQSDVEAVLAVEPLDKERLEELREVGVNLDFDMDEMVELEQALEQTKWIQEVSQSLHRTKSASTEGHYEEDDDGEDLVTVEDLRSLVRRGQSLPVHADVDKYHTELENLLKICQSWEEKASICLQAQPQHTVSTIEAILSGCDDIEVYLPNIESLRDSLERSHEWKKKTQNTLNSVPHPTLEQLKAMISKAKTFPVKLDIVEDINLLIAKSEEWKAEACENFLKSGSTAPLLDILLPRHENKSPNSRKRPQPVKKSSKARQRDSNSTHVPNDKLIDCRFSTEDMYEKSAMSEIASMKELRLTNESADTPRFCRCGLNTTSSMFQCVLCKEWLHYSCSDLTPESQYQIVSSIAEENQFLCPSCIRSKRPKLDIILKLLLALQRIPARLVEGEALQSLTERTISWQERAQEFISSQKYQQLNKKFDGIHAKNEYWKNIPEEEEEEEEEEELPQILAPHDHNYIASLTLPVLVSEKKVHPVFDIPDVEPDQEFCSRLKQLLLEGHLLEVTILELSQLYKFNKVLDRYKLDKLRPPPKPQSAKKTVLSSMDTNIKASKPRTTKSSKQGALAPSAADPMQEDTVTSTTSILDKRMKKKKEKKPPEPKSKKRKTSAAIVIQMGSDEEEEGDGEAWGEYDERCAAIDGCLLPDDESISWVQCEKCELWFHFVCIGVDPEHLADANYFCVVCKPPNEDYDFSDEEIVRHTTDILVLEGPNEESISCPSSSSNISTDSKLSDMSSASSQRFKPILKPSLQAST